MPPNNFTYPYDLWRKKCPTRKTLNKLHHKENAFQLKSNKKCVILFIDPRKIPLTVLVTVGLSDSFLACELELAYPVTREP